MTTGPGLYRPSEYLGDRPPRDVILARLVDLDYLKQVEYTLNSPKKWLMPDRIKGTLGPLIDTGLDYIDNVLHPHDYDPRSLEGFNREIAVGTAICMATARRMTKKDINLIAPAFTRAAEAIICLAPTKDDEELIRQLLKRQTNE